MKNKELFLLISIIPQRTSEITILRELKEVKALVESYGGIVVDLITQHREVHDKGMYIGQGKVTEVLKRIEEMKIGVVVLNATVKPGQLFDLKKLFRESSPNIEVWDRIDLILEIFSKHADTAEAKLQIDLAAMRHMGPRIYGMGFVLSRQGGGIGGRGIGETNTELMQRHWRDQMKKVQDKLNKLTGERERQLARRQKAGLSTISIIGYTNAGKTSLYNRLSGKKKLAKNILFATLDSSVAKMYLPEVRKEVLVSDTIGFINNLPSDLIDAFKSTLMESVHADVLIHVIDASDPEMEKKINVVENILYQLKIGNTKRIYVFNKIDAAADFDREDVSFRYQIHDPQFVSVKEDQGIEKLVKAISQEFEINSLS